MEGPLEYEDVLPAERGVVDLRLGEQAHAAVGDTRRVPLERHVPVRLHEDGKHGVGKGRSSGDLGRGGGNVGKLPHAETILQRAVDHADLVRVEELILLMHRFHDEAEARGNVGAHELVDRARVETSRVLVERETAVVGKRDRRILRRERFLEHAEVHAVVVRVADQRGQRRRGGRGHQILRDPAHVGSLPIRDRVRVPRRVVGGLVHADRVTDTPRRLRAQIAMREACVVRVAVVPGLAKAAVLGGVAVGPRSAGVAGRGRLASGQNEPVLQPAHHPQRTTLARPAMGEPIRAALPSKGRASDRCPRYRPHRWRRREVGPRVARHV